MTLTMPTNATHGRAAGEAGAIDGPVVAAIAGLVESTTAASGTIARAMFGEADVDATLSVVVTLARQTFRCDAAGVLLVRDGVPSPAAASHPDAARADAIQVNRRQGPGWQAVDRQQPVIVTELRSDSRWRFWAPLAADLGFRSVLSVRLADGDMSGALNLYSRTAHQFHSDDLAAVNEFAQHASIAIAVAQERQQLIQAIESRGVVGQAQGILMQRYGVTSAQAFTVLRRYSSHLNVKLRVIAEGIIRDRQLPELDSPAPEPTDLPPVPLLAG
jgi:GAF domain-containing protein